MSYKIGTATDMGDLLVQLSAFLTVGHPLDPQYVTGGDGVIEDLIGTTNSVVETITVTFTSASAFSVSGSVSGPLGSGTAGAAFTSNVCAFKIVAGSIDFASGDKITFAMSLPWDCLRAANINLGTDEYIWRAPGSDGDSDIYVGMLRFNNASADYDNVRLGGFAGFAPSMPFTAQPGPCTGPVMPGLRIGLIPYWFIANGRRAIVIIKCTSVYEGAYLGFLRQYWNPPQWPYPLVVGGSMAWASEPAATSTNWRWSYAGTENNLIVFGNQINNVNKNNFNLRLRVPNGVWNGFGIYTATPPTNAEYGYVWPYNGGRFTFVMPNLDGTYALFPIVLSESYWGEINQAQYGEMDGMFAVTGYENAVENIISIDRKKYLVMQNVFRTTRADYCAIKLS